MVSNPSSKNQTPDMAGIGNVIVGAGWYLPWYAINDLQRESVDRQIKRTKAAHYTNVKIRINGQWEESEADWIKHLVKIDSAHETPADAGKTKLAIVMLERFRDGRLQTAEGTHTSLLGPRDQLLEEADWFDHAAKVLRSTLSEKASADELYRHRKTGRMYRKVSEVRDCTNATDGRQMVLYTRADGIPGPNYVRDTNEFAEKFESTQNGTVKP